MSVRALGDVVPAVDALGPAPTPRFVAMLAVDARDAADAKIEAVVRALIDRGACAFACAGPDRARVEEVADGVAIPLEEAGAPAILTSSHKNVAAAVQFAGWVIVSDEYKASCGWVLEVRIGDLGDVADVANDGERAAKRS